MVEVWNEDLAYHGNAAEMLAVLQSHIVPQATHSNRTTKASWLLTMVLVGGE